MKPELKHITHIYFLGIGGIGMSALARYFNHIGKKVAGYDLTQTSLTENLASEGMQVFYDENENLIPQDFKKENTLVIFTPAVPSTHKGFCWLKENGFTFFKRAQVLGMLCNQGKSLAVAGTHGKTTVSSMAALILHESSIGGGAFLGGILKNIQSNLILPDNEEQWLVTEADEYDRSFLNLFPNMALITAIDADHLDIYGNENEIQKAFAEFASQVKEGGTLIIKSGINLENVSGKKKILTYSLQEKADYFAENIISEGDGYKFDLVTPKGKIKDFKLKYPGLINVENAVAASALALEAGVPPEEVKSGVALYQGVRRRFDIRFRNKNLLFIDDYAHHPKELEAAISSVRKLYPGKKVAGIFQPHLFTRTRDFADGFALALQLLDKAVILPIYPARENPIEGVTSEIILKKMGNSQAQFLEKEEAVSWALANKWDILITLGAGNIDKVADNIAKELEVKYG